jgi:hypothetical protein
MPWVVAEGRFSGLALWARMRRFWPLRAATLATRPRAGAFKRVSNAFKWVSGTAKGTRSMKGLREEVLWWLTYVGALLALAGLFLAPNGLVQLAAISALVAATIKHAQQSRPAQGEQPVIVKEEARSKPTNDEMDAASDRQLLIRFLALNPDRILRKPLHEAGLGGILSVGVSDLEHLKDFARDWRSATCELSDKTLDRARSMLVGEIDSFCSVVRLLTEVRDGRLVWKDATGEELSAGIRKVRASSISTCMSYDDFVRALKKAAAG